MYARVVSNQIQPGKMDQWLDLIRESIVPALREQNGFLGFVAPVDREHDRSIGYSIWTSPADLAASETSGNYREQMGKPGGVLAGPPAREVCEVTVVA